jgi:hypothetical protein
MYKMYLGLHVKYFLLLLDFIETWIFWTDFRDMLIELHESPSSGNRIVHADGQTIITKLTVASWNLRTCQ